MPAEERRAKVMEGLGTTYLFEKAWTRFLKGGRGGTEVNIALGAPGSQEHLAHELADLAYHVLVLMVEAGISPTR